METLPYIIFCQNLPNPVSRYIALIFKLVSFLLITLEVLALKLQYLHSIAIYWLFFLLDLLKALPDLVLCEFYR